MHCVAAFFHHQSDFAKFCLRLSRVTCSFRLKFYLALAVGQSRFQSPRSLDLRSFAVLLEGDAGRGTSLGSWVGSVWRNNGSIVNFCFRGKEGEGKKQSNASFFILIQGVNWCLTKKSVFFWGSLLNTWVNIVKIGWKDRRILPSIAMNTLQLDL